LFVPIPIGPKRQERTVRSIWLLLALVLAASCVAEDPADSSNLDLFAMAGPYLGQEPPGMTPKIFAPGVVSAEGWDAAPSFSPDGTEFLFTRREDIQAGARANRLLYMKMENGQWTRPAPPPFAMDVGEYEAFFSPDGKRIYYDSYRARPSGASGEGRIWSVERHDSGFGEPQYLPDVINANWVMFVTAAQNGTLYFNSMVGRQHGVFRSVVADGRYTTPELLPVEINGVGGAAHPFIAPDESYLLFDAQPSGPGRTDLYVCFRKSDGAWSEAIKLDPSVNATKTENIPNVSPDGKYLFFHRENDIWWVSSEVIEKLRPR
jgi:hypothetical protein